MSLVLAHLGLNVNACETGRNWERRDLAGKARQREMWNTVCVTDPTEKVGAVQGQCWFGVLK